MLKEKTKKTIERHRMISGGDVVLVGVSGGPDSMALLHVLLELRTSYDITIKVAHMNHGFRREAEEEARFVKETVDSMGIEACIRFVDVPALKKGSGMSSQEAAREARYDFFREALHETESSKVALAHNSDDQAETVLLRLLRGAGPSGLRGMSPVRDIFIRPLIDCSRREIEEFIAQNGVPYITDSSNLSTDYVRNRVRLELMPFLESYNPNIKETLVRTADLLNDDADFLDAEGARIFKQLGIEEADGIAVKVRELKNLHPAMLSRVIRIGISGAKGDLRKISFLHISSILKSLREGEGRWTLHLPDVTVCREHDWLIFKMGKGRR